MKRRNRPSPKCHELFFRRRRAWGLPPKGPTHREQADPPEAYRYMGLKKLCRKLLRWAQECPRFTTASGMGPSFL